MTSYAADPAGRPAREPSVHREFVTPERAKELLATGGPNRNLQESWVRELIRLLTEGRFREIGDTIRLSWDGTLLDGQHRLTAVARSGISVWMWIATGIDPAAQDVMDRGRRRTVGDVLAIHGYSQGNMLAAAVKWVILLPELARRPSPKVVAKGEQETAQAKPGKTLKNERGAFQITPDEALEALEKYPALVNSLQAGRDLKTSALRYPPALAVALHYLISEKAGAEAASEFFEAVATGVGLEKGDPVWRLRDQLQRDESRPRGRMPTVGVAAWTIRAWNAWQSGRQTGILKYYPDYFPEIEVT